ncbi:glycosyltransferase [Methylomonas sp. MS20]|uniref:glycosyltransferase n=1 Tax=unclassified Methylomonas TaxID=2608980 RepID=UPI0028A32775|nr:glycosyltransferase [Methylomonas sp. MV1]MDT4331894.1 glycosyltransferase [Methylomonas sp. MV1]
MQRPTIAIISTVLNERESIRQLLDAFLRQSLRADEIVIVDGGSSDGTLDVLNAYAAEHRNVKFFVEPGVNIAQGRNIAIARSHCDIVAVTDGGCRPVDGWLAALVQPLLNDPNYGAVTGVRNVESINDFEFFAGKLSTSGNAANEEERVFHGRNSAFRKSVWLAAGGYPEWLYTAEDTLFAQRAKALGCKVAVAPEAIISWRPRPNLKKLAKQYYLYGKGTGRIGQTDLKTVFYHLRNHVIWMLALLLGFGFFGFWLIAMAVLSFMFFTLVNPVITTLKRNNPDLRPSYWFYVPVIVMVRSFCNNLGQLSGYWEYRGAGVFRDNLERYRSGDWKSPFIAG